MLGPVSYSFSGPARADLVDISEYTAKRWGATQRRRYLEGLFAFLELITHAPNAGRPRDDLRAGLRVRSYHLHRIYYLIGADGVVVVRILHVRRDEQSLFRP